MSPDTQDLAKDLVEYILDSLLERMTEPSFLLVDLDDQWMQDLVLVLDRILSSELFTECDRLAGFLADSERVYRALATTLVLDESIASEYSTFSNTVLRTSNSSNSVLQSPTTGISYTVSESALSTASSTCPGVLDISFIVGYIYTSVLI